MIGYAAVALAATHLKAGHYEQALQQYDEGIRIYNEAGQPDDVQALRSGFNRIRTLMAMGRHEDAFEDWPAFLDRLLAKGGYRDGAVNALRLVDAELHQRLAIDDRACRVRADLVEPTAEDLAKLAVLEASCAL